MCAWIANCRWARILSPSPPALRATRSTWSMPAPWMARVQSRSSTLKTTPSQPPFRCTGSRRHRSGRRGQAGLRRQLRFQLHLRCRSEEPARIGPDRSRRGARCRAPVPGRQNSGRRQPQGRLPESHRPASMSLRSIFAGCPGASDVAILPDSLKAFVACSAGHQVMSVALARAAQPAAAQPGSAPATPAQPDRLEALIDVGRSPAQVALKPDGGEIFVVNSLSNSISESLPAPTMCRALT